MSKMNENNERKGLLMHTMEGGVWLGIFLIVRFFCSVMSVYSSLLNMIAMLLFIATPFVLYKLMLSCHRKIGSISSFSLLLMMGFMLFFFGSIISAIPEYVFYEYINPDYITDALTRSMELIEHMNLIQDEVAMQEMKELLATESLFTPFQMVMSSMWSNLFFGLLLSIIVAPFVLRTKK